MLNSVSESSFFPPVRLGRFLQTRMHGFQNTVGGQGLARCHHACSWPYSLDELLDDRGYISRKVRYFVDRV